jgi:hypothetical protein
MEKQTKVALALVVPLWVFVNLLACKVYCPCFICEHAYFAVGTFILDEHASFIVSLSLLLLAVLVIIKFSTCASTSRSRGWWLFFRLHLESWRVFHVEKAKGDLADKRSEVSDPVISLVLVYCRLAFL